MSKEYIFDLESNGLLDDLTKIHCLEIRNASTGAMRSYADQPGFRPIREGLDVLLNAATIIGHNIISFDTPALEKVYGVEFDKDRLVDTLVLSRLTWPDQKDRDLKAVGSKRLPGKLIGRHSLEAWGYRLGFHKGDFGKDNDPSVWAEWSLEMQTYCRQDVKVTSRLWSYISENRPTTNAWVLEHQFQQLIAKQVQHGIAFNVEEAVKLQSDLVKEKEKLKSKIGKAFPPREYYFTPKANNRKYGYQKGVPIKRETSFNPTSRQQIAERLKEKGWIPTEFTENGQEKITEDILSTIPMDEAQLLAQHFLIEKRLSQLAEGEQAWLKLVTSKGRIHGGVNTIGAVTRRCTHSNPNLAQVPGVGAPWGFECRRLFAASKGMKLVGADLAGIELRCLAHYMARWDKGAYRDVLLEGDVHWANVQALGFTQEARDPEDPLHKLYRNGAKTFIYGFLYGAGNLKIGTIIYNIALDAKRQGLDYQPILDRYFDGNINPDEAALSKAGSKLKESFLKTLPALKNLIDSVSAKAKNRGYLEALDGGLLPVRHQHAALNTLLQSAGALISKKFAVLAYEELCDRGYVWGKDFAQVIHCHDEVQYECRPEITNEVGEVLVHSMVLAGECFNFRCPITGDYSIGDNWADTH